MNLRNILTPLILIPGSSESSALLSSNNLTNISEICPIQIDKTQSVWIAHEENIINNFTTPSSGNAFPKRATGAAVLVAIVVGGAISLNKAIAPDEKNKTGITDDQLFITLTSVIFAPLLILLAPAVAAKVIYTECTNSKEKSSQV